MSGRNPPLYCTLTVGVDGVGGDPGLLSCGPFDAPLNVPTFPPGRCGCSEVLI